MPITTERFWDCECESNFIHPKAEKSCNRCGSKAKNQPDSHVNEVLAMLRKEVAHHQGWLRRNPYCASQPTNHLTQHSNAEIARIKALMLNIRKEAKS